MRTHHLALGRRRIPHRTIRVCLLLLPVWILGAGEFQRLAANNMTEGVLERNGFVKGRDFVQFYVAGSLARDGRWREIYDVEGLKAAVARIVPEAAGDVPAPVYGPQVALLFAPWSELSYLTARWAWFAMSVALYVGAIALLLQTAAPMRQHRALVWTTALLNPAFPILLGTGQTGGLAVLFWTVAAVAASRGRALLFGLCLGLLEYKPPLVIGALPVLLILRWWPALGGFALSVGMQVGASALVAGVRPWALYLETAAGIRRYYYLTDTIPHYKQSVAGFFQLLLGTTWISVALTGVAAVALLALWLLRRSHRPIWLVPMLITTAVLLSPHFYVYDLVVLAPALLMAAYGRMKLGSASSQRALAASGYALLLAPYSGVIAARSGIQLSTLALAVFLVALFGCSRADDQGARPAAAPADDDAARAAGQDG